ncbi:elongation factor P maturation arginine rhamnosyltransferase EarP [Massilia sp. S19_KUP03_FR1]|uniref:elongation factor P maturation arginine rhamnosyltransferase EarP n=1 Tax=Massilia sp. S19_KUP03_FR1 TaxID=3025503 RepID=UPI002FCDAD53
MADSHSLSLVIFCRVVDNYGDIGICWRLARQLQAEHDVAVTLWVDDLISFKRICPAIDVDAAQQAVAAVCVQHWRDQEGVFAPHDIADIVIEFFACDIPPRYIQAMAQRTPRPVWLNLEGLTAEEWVEGCHTLPSMHPQLPLTKHFFFPGFTAKTGGLLREGSLDDARRAFQADPAAQADFLANFGVTATDMQATRVSLFCYPQAPVADLFAAWRDGTDPVLCLVPEGVAVDAVSAFVGTNGALTVRVLPFVAQPDYDKLLWACDLNFVRGEDSFVRAQWAGKPFIWHIYHQDENLHHVKLGAFLQRYASPAVSAFAMAWNGVDTGAAPDWSALWQALYKDADGIAARAHAWQREMHSHGDLASNLLGFACSLRARPMI